MKAVDKMGARFVELGLAFLITCYAQISSIDIKRQFDAYLAVISAEFGFDNIPTTLITITFLEYIQSRRG